MWCVVFCVRCLVIGEWCVVCGAWCVVCGAWCGGWNGMWWRGVVRGGVEGGGGAVVWCGAGMS